MPQAKQILPAQPGLVFGKLLGSGAGAGFSLWPDFSTYVLLTVWESHSDYQLFTEHPWYMSLLEHNHARTRVKMHPLRSKGSWEGKQPFSALPEYSESLPYTAVLTRARIRLTSLLHFWRNVPQVSKSMRGQAGLLFSKGIGEWPLIEQATFSLWQDQNAIDNFAYRKHQHQQVIQKTYKNQWYSEELFARFQILSLEGPALWSSREPDIKTSATHEQA